jgi:hypothetical protein
MWSPQQRLLDGLDFLREELAGKSDAEQRERKDTGEHVETQDCAEYDGADHLLDVRSIHTSYLLGPECADSLSSTWFTFRGSGHVVAV